MAKRISSIEVQNNQFYQIPQWLIHNPKFAKLTDTAKIVYTLLKDRNNLSIKNNWQDKNGDVYIYFTRKAMAEKTNKSVRTIIKSINQLKHHGLIDEVRQGLNKPNRIYILQPEALEIHGVEHSASQELKKVHKSQTDNIQTDISIKSVSLEEDPAPEEKDLTDLTDNKKEIDNIFESIQADLFQDDSRKAIKTAIIGLWYKPWMEIQGTRYQQQQIRNLLQSLSLESIDHAFWKLRQQNKIKPIKNKAKYLQACIVTASIEAPASTL